MHVQGPHDPLPRSTADEANGAPETVSHQGAQGLKGYSEYGMVLQLPVCMLCTAGQASVFVALSLTRWADAQE